MANIEDLRDRSVSSGTLKSEDLIPKFLGVLKTYGKDKYDKYIKENPEVEDWENLDDETMGWVVDELTDLLNEIAPDGCYFGASEGDGADFGFWSMSNESKKSEDFDMNQAFFQAKKAITDWTKRQGHKTLEWLYTDGRKSPTSYPSGIWDFEWDTGNGMATAELKVSPYETRTNSWNDRMDFGLRVGTEDKPTFYTSVEDVLSALDTLISKTEIKMESKKSESLTLKQKELKDMARFGQAEDITTISDAEAKELKKKGIETVGISRGTYGMNGALLRDSEGNKYVITARSSNLFYFV